LLIRIAAAASDKLQLGLSQQKVFSEFLVEVGILESRILPVHRSPRFPRQFTPFGGGEGQYHAEQRPCHSTFLIAYEGLSQLISRSPPYAAGGGGNDVIERARTGEGRCDSRLIRDVQHQGVRGARADFVARGIQAVLISAGKEHALAATPLF
jgi:hypothetical protein